MLLTAIRCHAGAAETALNARTPAYVPPEVVQCSMVTVTDVPVNAVT